MAKIVHPPEVLLQFFANSDWLDRMVLRPLSHITLNWEASWNLQQQRYTPEPDSFADDLNAVILQIAMAPRPDRYHDHEDALAIRVLTNLRWPIQKKGGRWIGADYQSILEQGAFSDLGQADLATAAAGRVHTAIEFGQSHFDKMDGPHLTMLAALMTIMIYQRYCDGSSLIQKRRSNGGRVFLTRGLVRERRDRHGPKRAPVGLRSGAAPPTTEVAGSTHWCAVDYEHLVVLMTYCGASVVLLTTGRPRQGVAA